MKFPYEFLVRFIQRYKKTIFLIIITVLVTVLFQSSISVWLSRNDTISIPSFGTIYTLYAEVYGGDLKELNNSQKFLDWGTVYPGSMISRKFNVTSKSNVEGILIIKALNWVFNNSQGVIVEGPTNETDYMKLTASLNGTLIIPNQSLEVTLTLIVSDSKEFRDFIVENSVASFSFDLHVKVSNRELLTQA